MNDTALLIIDVQCGMFDEADPAYDGSRLLATLAELIARARASGIPILYLQHDGEGENNPLAPGRPGWPIHPAVAPSPADPVIHKRHPDAFQDTPLQQELAARGIRNLVVAGLQTEFCVDTTCRRAYGLGYHVTLVQDGHSTWNTNHLKAPQIIDHHNQVLGGWFATVKTAANLDFGPTRS